MNWYVENSEFQKELEDLLNRHCKENGSNTPDFILSEYLMECLRNFDRCVSRRTDWYGYGDFKEKLNNICECFDEPPIYESMDDSIEEVDDSPDKPEDIRYVNCNDEKVTLHKQWPETTKIGG